MENALHLSQTCANNFMLSTCHGTAQPASGGAVYQIEHNFLIGQKMLRASFMLERSMTANAQDAAGL